jgi:hypothetical protein
VRRRVAAAAAVALASVACGTQSGGAPRSTPLSASAQPSAAASGPAGPVLFAALEPGGDLTAMKDDTVAIVQTNGRAKARAKFDPRQLPAVGNALPLPQPEARVAAGRVYYADGAGVVRSLAVDGTVATVTTFPLTGPQQLLSFAVSPDGSQLVATVFSFPPVHVPKPQTPIDPPFGPGDFSLQVLGAKPGQAATNLGSRRTWAQSGGLPRDALSVVGWSQDAPLATIDTELGTQEGSLGRQIFGHVAELDTAGRPGQPLNGYGCDPWTVLPNETMLCDADSGHRAFTVQSKDGTARYHLQAPGEAQFLSVSLAPDAAHVAYLPTSGSAQVVDASGKVTQLPANFRPEGWLDSTTVIGVMQTPQGEGDMATVRVDRPTRLTDLGFHGFFVGVVQG